MSTPRIALIAGGLVLASLTGVKLLEGLRAASSQVSFATESPTDLERLARAIPAATARAGAAGAPASGQIDFTSTANASGKRTLQSACHGGERTVSMVAPAGGAPMVLSTCASAKTGRE
ncbi:MAG: hypothetical protein JOZ84_10660 [Methylobacteriaceae bacterium]|nr:hypothetical protein [Methylobacteriaceae bacterium]